MKIAIAQINTQIGHFSANVEKILQGIENAKKKKADLIVFPELTLTGYPPKDLLDKPSFIEKNLSALQQVVKKTRGIACILGFVELNDEEVGKSLYNSAAFIKEGKIQNIIRKRLLPTYDVFDERRYFEAGDESFVFVYKGRRIGLSICEDIWNDKSILGRKLYPINPIEELAVQGADLLINISASPYSMGKRSLREKLLSKVAQTSGNPLLYVNLVGGNDDLIFDGSSLVYDGDGKICNRLKSFEEDFQVIDIDQLKPEPYHQVHEMEKVRKALVLGIRDYMQKSGFKKAILGLSGGIDSCLVATLAAEACGSKNVLGVSMPSPFSSQSSLSDAKALAKNLGIQYLTLPIGKIFKAYPDALEWDAKPRKVDVALQNIQARIRGNLLMALSNREGYLLLSTGNKSEMAVGYCTLYGDMAGGLAVISDLPKTLVYQLSRYLNKKHRAIPESVFRKAPSAELAPNQKDQDDLPPYEILDEILKLYVEDNKSPTQIIKLGYSKKIVKDIVTRVDRNEYKRQQASPGLRITSKAFGYGRRIPLTNGFKE